MIKRYGLLPVLALAVLLGCVDGTERGLMGPDAKPAAVASEGGGDAALEGATVWTDKHDYQPGDTVTISGAGWWAGETVHLHITEDPQNHPDHDFYVEANDAGGFVYRKLVMDDEHLGVTFTLTATGQSSGLLAGAVFTDANSEIIDFSIAPTPTTPGGELTWSASAECTGPSGGGPASCSSHGTSVGGPVPNGYTIQLLQAPGACGEPGQVFSQVASASTTGGTAGGTITAPVASGSYAYRTRHPQQMISGNNWPAVGDGTTDCITILVEAANQPPVADAGDNYEGDEGSRIQLDGSNSSDPDGDDLTYLWTIGLTGIDAGGTCSFFDPSDLNDTGSATSALESPEIECTDDSGAGTFTLTLRVTDPEGLYDEDTASLTVNNVAPTITDVLVTPFVDGYIYPITGQPAIDATYSDPGSNDTHTCIFEVFDSADNEVGIDRTCGANLGVSEAGVYTAKVTVTDDDGDSDEETIQVVVYDPEAGFVTGGGWIYSPAGAYRWGASLEGKATFGFVSKYKKGANKPDGNTQFVFHAGDLNFHSSDYEWLVVNQAGTNAQYKGTGVINGTGEYSFMLWASDGAPDTFRICIWEGDGECDVYAVYDNGSHQPLGGGSIVIHTGGKKK